MRCWLPQLCWKLLQVWPAGSALHGSSFVFPSQLVLLLMFAAFEGISDGERYHGTIKSWGPGTPSTQRLKCTIVFKVRKMAQLLFPMCLIRFGFITCPDLAQRFTRDVYLPQAACFSACEAADHRQTEDDGSLLPVRSTRIGHQARP